MDNFQCRQARLNDINILIQTMSPALYILSAIFRACIAIFILAWFWPEKLICRFYNPNPLIILIPFAYRETHRYFGASLVMIIIPVKAMAAWNNMQIINGCEPTFNVLSALALGFVLGLVLSNLIFYFHFRSQ